MAAILAIGSSVASALQTHDRLPGEDPDTVSVLHGTCCFAGLAVDQSGGDLYAVDQFDPTSFGWGLLHRFDAGGAYDQAFDEATQAFSETLAEPHGVAVDNSGGASDGTVYVADSAHNSIVALDSTGAPLATYGDTEGGPDGRLNGFATPAGSFSYPTGLAVDQADGSLLVADQGSNRIWVFDESGAYLGRIFDSAIAAPAELAIDAGGRVYVRNADGRVVAFDRTALGEYEFATVFYAPGDNGTPEDPSDDLQPATGIASDPANGHLYVNRGDRISEYEGPGGLVSTFGQGALSGSAGALAIDASAGKLYVADGGAIRAFSTALITVPDVTTNPASSVGPTGGTLNGTLDPPSGFETTDCYFEWGTDTSYGNAVPCAEGDAFTEARAVTAPLTDLDPGGEYHYRFVVANGEGENTGADQSFVTPAAPVVSLLAVADVSSSRATLSASIDPKGAATAYRFEYVAAPAFETSGFAGALKAPVPDAVLAPGQGAVKVSVQVAGLAPDTVYRYRVVAANAAAPVTSETKIFKTFPAALAPLPGQFPGQGFLPDNRAWELVTPPGKKADIVGDSSRTRAASNGNALGFTSFSAFSGVQGTGLTAEYIAKRSADPAPGGNGWHTHGVTPNQVPLAGAATATMRPGYEGEYSADLERAIFSTYTPLTGDANTAKVANLYRRDDMLTPGGGSYQLLTRSETALPPLPLVRSDRRRPKLVSASPDLSRVIFESTQHLTADTPPDPTGTFPLGCDPEVPLNDCRVHLFESDGETTRLAGRVPEPVDPPARPAPTCSDAVGPACVAADVSVGGRGVLGQGENGYSPRTISDGSDGHLRVFFTQPTDAEGRSSDQLTDFDRFGLGSSNGRLFMRLDGLETVQLSASERSDCAGDPDCGGDGMPDPSPAAYSTAQFADASTDGQRVFFTSTEPLTDDAPEGGRKLYMYDATKGPGDPHNLTLLSMDSEPADSAEVTGVIGASADGAYVYFVATGQLVAGGPLLQKAIYAWHDGDLIFVAPLNDEETTVTNNVIYAGYGQQARVNPDGTHLLFATRGVQRDDGSFIGPTGFDHGLLPVGYPRGTTQIYVFDAVARDLQCASCSPSGATPSGDTLITSSINSGLTVRTSHHGHALSDDGRFAFFSSPEQLAPEDVNGSCLSSELGVTNQSSGSQVELAEVSQCVDTYVYDSVRQEVDLLSSGKPGARAYFLDASADGRDAFFVTRQRLSGWDTDDSYDVYDARVNGGFPEPIAAPPPCVGDRCQGVPGTPPPMLRASAVAGPGNPVIRRHKKKHRKAKKRAHKHRKHHKHKKHHKHEKHHQSPRSSR